MPLPRFLLLLLGVIVLAGATVLVLFQLQAGYGLAGISAVFAVALALKFWVGHRR